MRAYDVSLPIREGMPVWPGDPPVLVEGLCSVPAGDAFSVSRLSLGSHAGTHVDAPSHLLRHGRTVDELSLEALCGPAWLCSLPEPRIIIGAHLAALELPAGCRRLLLRTANAEPESECVSTVDPTYVAFDESAARWVVERNILLIGIDGPSIEPFGKDMGPVHRLLLEADIVIVEGLALRGVPPGEYELICLPLRIVGGDGAPARALLRAP